MFTIESMNKTGRAVKGFLVVGYLLFVHLLAGMFVYRQYIAPHVRTDDSFQAGVDAPIEETPVPTIIPVPSLAPPEANANVEADQTADANAELAVNANGSAATNAPPDAPPSEAPPSLSSDALMIPVAGVRREQLTDTFDAARAEGREHDAIDIIAPGGAPVVAAADGEIAKFFDSKAGGITIYQYSRDKRYVYYYAHLQRRADGLREKQFVTQGTVIGYVGDTGNSGAGNYHLHFSIALLKDPARYWEGDYLNPFPLLRTGKEKP